MTQSFMELISWTAGIVCCLAAIRVVVKLAIKNNSISPQYPTLEYGIHLKILELEQRLRTLEIQHDKEHPKEGV